MEEGIKYLFRLAESPVDVILLVLDLFIAIVLGYYYKIIMNTIPAKIKEEVKEVKEEIKEVREELKGEIKEVKEEVKKEVKKEIKEVREELKGEIKEVREELKGEIKEVKEEVKKEIKGVDQKMDKINDKLDIFLLHLYNMKKASPSEKEKAILK